jgi:hypothetical protein
MSANAPGSSPFARFGRWLAIVLFMAAQISAGTVARTVSPADYPAAMLHAAMVLCVGAKHSPPDGPAPLHHHVPDPALAAASFGAAQPAALPQSGGTIPPFSQCLICWVVVPPACGPPARFAGHACPTGPPDRLT